jgi:hypothetical protein
VSPAGVDTAARRRVLAAVVARMPRPGRRSVVAVDGVDGAGKTTFADELAAVLAEDRSAGEVERASVDGFHHPRARRYAAGRTGETFWSDSYDYPDHRRYVEGQRIYLATCDPRGRADLLVDNRDLGAPRVVASRGNRSAAGGV